MARQIMHPETEEQAKAKMVEAYLDLVVSVAKGYKGLGVPLSDLIQEGNVGLFETVAKFEWHGHKFTTRVIESVQQAIIRALADQARTSVTLNGFSGLDFIEDQNASPLEAAISMNLTESTRRALTILTPREEKVLRMRFGIGDDKDHTLDEVGVTLKVTRERIRQIEAKALRKLRHPRAMCRLRAWTPEVRWWR